MARHSVNVRAEELGREARAASLASGADTGICDTCGARVEVEITGAARGWAQGCGACPDGVIRPVAAEARTRHAPTCARVFSRLDSACPRCRELAAGAAPREGWGARRARDEAAELRSIDAHFAPGGPHARGACGPVCTFGDW